MKYITSDHQSIDIKKLNYITTTYNLFNKNDFRPYDVLRADGSITAQGDSWGCSNLIKCTPNTQYTLYCPYPNGDNWGGYNRFSIYDSSKNFLRLSEGIGYTDIRILNFTTPEDCEYFRINLMYGYATSGRISAWKDCQILILEGNYTINNIPNYAEMGYYSIRNGNIINPNSNLWSFADKTEKLPYSTPSTKRLFQENTYYFPLALNNYSGIEDAQLLSADKNYISLISHGGYGVGRRFNCSSNQTYTLSCKAHDEQSTSGVMFFQEDGTYINHVSIISTSTFSGSFTTPENCSFFVVVFRTTPTGPLQAYFEGIQLELGSEATSYQPYNHVEFK